MNPKPSITELMLEVGTQPCSLRHGSAAGLDVLSKTSLIVVTYDRDVFVQCSSFNGFITKLSIKSDMYVFVLFSSFLSGIIKLKKCVCDINGYK